MGGERDAVDERAVAPMVPDARPRALRRRAQRPEDARQLVLDRAAREQRTAREHLEEDTSNAPANSSAHIKSQILSIRTVLYNEQ